MDTKLDPRIITRKVNTEFPVKGSEKCPAYVSTLSSDSKIGLVLVHEWYNYNIILKYNMYKKIFCSNFIKYIYKLNIFR